MLTDDTQRFSHTFNKPIETKVTHNSEQKRHSPPHPMRRTTRPTRTPQPVPPPKCARLAQCTRSRMQRSVHALQNFSERPVYVLFLAETKASPSSFPYAILPRPATFCQVFFTPMFFETTKFSCMSSDSHKTQLPNFFHRRRPPCCMRGP